MKKILLFLLFLLTLNCSLNKVSNTHGTRLIENKYSKIVVNETNKNDVRNLIGPPSTMSKFDDTWLYIERKKTNQTLFKLGKKKISKNDILVLKFNSMGMVSKKELLGLADMNNLKIEKKKTFKKYANESIGYNILSTLREKINAPTRRKSGGP